MRELDAQTLTMPVSTHRDHILGPPQAPQTLVEYGDFECPHCAQAHFILQDLMADAGDQLRLVYRHFPLSQIHPHALRAAEAAEAAGAQRKFWEMHDLLFENQEALEDDNLVEFATELGLDLDRFQIELATSRHARRVREDFLSGVRSGVNGTPTFYINGRRHDGPWDRQSLINAIQMSLHARRQRDDAAHSYRRT